MTIREVITQLLQYPMDAPLFVKQGGTMFPAVPAQFTAHGEINIEEPQTGFYICSELELAASQQSEAVEAQEEAAE